AGVISSGGSSGCEAPFALGSVITLTETPTGTSTFISWSGYPGCSTATTCVVTLNSNTTVTANFTTSMATSPLSLVQTSTNCAVSGMTIACLWASAQNAGDAN